jgi:hypothetical protein
MFASSASSKVTVESLPQSRKQEADDLDFGRIHPYTSEFSERGIAILEGRSEIREQKSKLNQSLRQTVVEEKSCRDNHSSQPDIQVNRLIVAGHSPGTSTETFAHNLKNRRVDILSSLGE